MTIVDKECFSPIIQKYLNAHAIRSIPVKIIWKTKLLFLCEVGLKALIFWGDFLGVKIGNPSIIDNLFWDQSKCPTKVGHFA